MADKGENHALGCTASIDQAQQVADAGFDFLEVNIQGVLQGNTPDADWQPPEIDKLPLPIEAANCLIPGNMPVIGPNRDLAALKTYMQRVGKRAKQVGIEYLVFGSGGARKRPDNVDEVTADDQLVEFLKLAGDACGPHGVKIVIEHLNTGETNTINKLAKARHLCDRAHHKAVGLLVDSYHWGLEQEIDQSILDLGDRLWHVHLAEPIDRIQPGGHGRSDKAFDFETFFTLLQKINYDERLSLECKFSRSLEADGPATIAFIQQMWADAAVDEPDDE